jgi:hypothetical protein
MHERENGQVDHSGADPFVGLTNELVGIGVPIVRTLYGFEVSVRESSLVIEKVHLLVGRPHHPATFEKMPEKPAGSRSWHSKEDYIRAGAEAGALSQMPVHLGIRELCSGPGNERGKRLVLLPLVQEMDGVASERAQFSFDHNEVRALGCRPSHAPGPQGRLTTTSITQSGIGDSRPTHRMAQNAPTQSAVAAPDRFPLRRKML